MSLPLMFTSIIILDRYVFLQTSEHVFWLFSFVFSGPFPFSLLPSSLICQSRVTSLCVFCLMSRHLMACADCARHLPAGCHCICPLRADCGWILALAAIVHTHTHTLCAMLWQGTMTTPYRNTLATTNEGSTLKKNTETTLPLNGAKEMGKAPSLPVGQYPCEA